MAEYQLIEERLVSGQGVLRFPGFGIKARTYALYLDVVRDAKNKYNNFAWLPSRSRYANITFIKSNYVIDSYAMEFDRSLIFGVNDISGQNLIAIKCAYDGILQSIFNLGQALNANPVSITNLISEYEALNLSWDEIRISCYADTAIQVRLFTLLYDSCDEDFNKVSKPPAPPAPREKVPSGTPIRDISPSYSDTDNPDAITNPFPGDGIPDGSQFPACTRLRVTYLADRTNVAGQVSPDAVNCYAPFTSIVIGNNPQSLIMTSFGRIVSGTGNSSLPLCLNADVTQEIDFYPGGVFTSVEILNIEELP